MPACLREWVALRVKARQLVVSLQGAGQAGKVEATDGHQTGAGSAEMHRGWRPPDSRRGGSGARSVDRGNELGFGYEAAGQLVTAAP